MIEVIEVKSKKDLDNFIKLPVSLYAKDPFYVPPLVKELHKQFSDKNPFFLHAAVRYFLAENDGKIQGRIVSIINQRHVDIHHEKAGFFGFYESSNDQEVAKALLNKVSDILRKEGMEIVRGPMNFSTNEECGFLAEGFDQPPILMTPYTHAYYNDLMEQCGLSKAKDLYAYILDTPE